MCMRICAVMPRQQCELQCTYAPMWCTCTRAGAHFALWHCVGVNVEDGKVVVECKQVGDELVIILSVRLARVENMRRQVSVIPGTLHSIVFMGSGCAVAACQNESLLLSLDVSCAVAARQNKSLFRSLSVYFRTLGHVHTCTHQRTRCKCAATGGLESYDSTLNT